jgi:Terminase large subunit, T4likevirus-type, N-terminal
MAFDKGFWKPNPKQEIFLAIPPTIFEGFYGGGNGSGKSDVLLCYGLVHRWHEYPTFKQVFMRRTYPEMKNEIVPRSREIYPKFGATFDKTDMVWTFPREDEFGGSGNRSGAMIFLGHCETEDDVHKYDSMEINLFTPDELTSFTEYIYLYIGFTRVRTNNPKLPAIIRAAGMPGNIGHTFAKKRFVTPYPKGGKIIEGKGGVKRFYVHATVADNPNADPEYAKRLDGIPNEAERKARKFGDWDAYQGQVFDELRTKRYPDEPENALHVIPPAEIPDWWPRMIIGDWGFAAMTYIGFYAISPDERLYLYRELNWLKTKIEEWAPVLKDYIDREHPEVVKFCKSVAQERGQEHTIQQQIEAALGVPIELSNNSPGSRVAGKMLLHEYLRWKPRPMLAPKDIPVYSEEYAMWVLRNKGLVDYKAYLALFDPPEEEKNIPRLQIMCCEATEHDGHPMCCPMMIEALQACSYDKKSKDGVPAEDVAEFDGDDPYDDIRYAVDSAERFFTESSRRMERLRKQEALTNALKNTQDWTAYYRNALAVETQTTKMQVAARFSHKMRRRFVR